MAACATHADDAPYLGEPGARHVAVDGLVAPSLHAVSLVVDPDARNLLACKGAPMSARRAQGPWRGAALQAHCRDLCCQTCRGARIAVPGPKCALHGHTAVPASAPSNFCKAAL